MRGIAGSNRRMRRVFEAILADVVGVDVERPGRGRGCGRCVGEGSGEGQRWLWWRSRRGDRGWLGGDRKVLEYLADDSVVGSEVEDLALSPALADEDIDEVHALHEFCPRVAARWIGVATGVIGFGLRAIRSSGSRTTCVEPSTRCTCAPQPRSDGVNDAVEEDRRVVNPGRG